MITRPSASNPTATTDPAGGADGDDADWLLGGGTAVPCDGDGLVVAGAAETAGADTALGTVASSPLPSAGPPLIAVTPPAIAGPDATEPSGLLVVRLGAHADTTPTTAMAAHTGNTREYQHNIKSDAPVSSTL